MAAGSSVLIPVLENDSDPEGDPRTVVGFDATTPAGGSIVCDARCVYTAAFGFTGVDTFTYTISDPGGLISAGAVTVMVTP